MVIAPDSAAATERRAAAKVSGVLAVIGWVLVASVIAWSYVGHSSSTYGACHNAQGRGIQCLAGHR